MPKNKKENEEEAQVSLLAEYLASLPKSPITVVGFLKLGYTATLNKRASSTHVDVYYFDKDDNKYRSKLEVARHLGIIKASKPTRSMSTSTSTSTSTDKSKSRAVKKPSPPPPPPSPAKKH